jgi:hypothetical protein
LKHVERLTAPYLADNDPIRSHAQGVPNQVAHGDLSTPFYRGRPTLPTPLWRPSSSTGSPPRSGRLRHPAAARSPPPRDQADLALLIATLEFALKEFPQEWVVAAGIRSITDRYE